MSRSLRNGVARWRSSQDGLQDIAGALVEGGVELPGNAGLVAARSTLVQP